MHIECQPTIEMGMRVDMGGGSSESNAEAWAVGERHGVPVDENDQTYHNNAKWYAENGLIVPVFTDNLGTWSCDTPFADVLQAIQEKRCTSCICARGATSKEGFALAMAGASNIIFYRTINNGAADIVTTDSILYFPSGNIAYLSDTVNVADAIDDTARAGDTHRAWSADKLTSELDLKAPKANPEFTGSISMGRLESYTTGNKSVAFGDSVEASAYAAFAEGGGTRARGMFSHSEGEATTASGEGSHAEGMGANATGSASHSEGNGTTASGNYSHAEGYQTIANHKSQHVFGELNIADDSSETEANRGNYVEIVGNGTGNNARSNARTLDWDGNEELAGDLTIKKGSADEVSVSELAEDLGDLKSAIKQKYDDSNLNARSGITVEVDTDTGKHYLIADVKRSDITNLQQNKADIIITSASGAIASISDGADDQPIEDMVVQIEPVQDLHGQESPYPAGGGKNLLFCDASKELRVNGGPARTYQNNGITIKATVVAAYYVILSVMEITEGIAGNTYTLSSQPNTATIGVFDPSNNSFDAVSGTKTRTVVSEDIGKYVAVRFYNDTGADLTWTNCQVELGSTATAFAPYSNICPISGWTGATVTRTGKNLIGGTTLANNIKANLASAIIDTDNKTVSYGYTATGGLDPVVTGKFKPLTQYTIIFSVINPTIARSNLQFVYSDGSYSAINLATVNTKEIIVATSLSGKTLKWVGMARQGGTTQIYYDESGIFEGVLTASDFKPYSGATYPITFPTEAGTVYGGTLNPVTGKLVVDHVDITLDGSQAVGLPGWQQKTGSSAWLYIPTQTPNLEEVPNGNTIPNIISDILPTVAYTPIYTGTIGISRVQGVGAVWGLAVRVPVEGLTTEQLINAWLAEHPIHVVYKVTNPQTYTLTPTEIRTLLGANNIWADTGDVSVEYRADTKLYIQQLTKPTEDDMTANANITSGKFFMIGNRLFLSTAAIAVGATIIPGTNCTELSLADALNNINA